MFLELINHLEEYLMFFLKNVDLGMGFLTQNQHQKYRCIFPFPGNSMAILYSDFDVC
jgi:hypothetical protein